MHEARWKFVVGGAIVVIALAILGFVGFQESKAYYVTVSEFFAMQKDIGGKSIKVAGDVVDGSIDRTKQPMEFMIAHQDKSLRVRYIGKEVIPDTFRNGSTALVEGTIAPDGVFQARHIEAKCASKYEVEYAKKGT